MRIPTIGWFALGFASTLAVSGSIAAARATERVPLERIDRGGYAVAKSLYGNQTVRGPVRQTSLGLQVKLPGGSWVYCRRSCSETLRVETVDFWASRNNPGGGPRESGLLNLNWRW